MSKQTNSDDLVHVRQMSQADFDAISVKDSTTIYFVNPTGVFTEQSLGEDGDIYLGSKLLTGQPDMKGVMKVNGTALVLNDFTGDSFVEEFEFSSELANTTILDFFLNATLKHASNTAVTVECWLELGHYEEGKYVPDVVVTSGQTTLAAAHNAVPVSANISMTGTLGGPLQSKFVRVCFEATANISVIRYTATNGIDRASQILIRTYQNIPQ